MLSSDLHGLLLLPDGQRSHYNASTAQKCILYLTPSLSFSFLLSLLAKSFCANMFGYQIKAATGAIRRTGIFLWQLQLMHPRSLAFPLLPSQQHGMPAALNRDTHDRCMQEETAETYRKLRRGCVWSLGRGCLQRRGMLVIPALKRGSVGMRICWSIFSKASISLLILNI